jgi:hypothetical protein
MKETLKLLLTSTLLALMTTVGLMGQTTDSVGHLHLIHQAEFSIAPNAVFQTKDFLEGVNQKEKRIDKSLSLHLKYGFQFAPDTRLGQLYPHTYQGIGVSYNTFFNSSELGNPVAVYVFQGSRIARLSNALSLDYEWNFGASFGWKPHDSETNQYNDVIGSNVNAYINLGLFLNWQMNHQWKMTAGVALTHFSNGNTRYPNAGLNLVGTRIGICRTFNASSADTWQRKESLQHPTTDHHLSYDVVIYGALRSKGIIEASYAVPGSFGILGFNVNPMYTFNKFLKAGASLDAQFDESANIENHIAGSTDNGEMRFYRPPFKERIGAGLSLRGEFVMPIFSINFGIGHNIIYHGEDWSGFYEILALKTDITRNLFLHVGYQLSDFHNPRNLMIGFGYRFHNKR